MDGIFDDWDPADQGGSLRRAADRLNDHARGVMAQAGTHVQLVFAVTEDGQGSLNPVPPGVTQEELAASIREAVRAHPICGVIIIAESWAYVPPRADDHTLRQIEWGELGVADLPRDQRTEVLMLHLQSRAGDCCTWLSPVRRTSARIELAPTILLEKPPNQHLANLFAE